MFWIIVSLVLAVSLAWLFFTRQPVCHGPQAGKRKPPAEYLLANPDLITYDGQDLVIPSLSGRLLSFFMWLTFTRFGRLIYLPIFLKGAALDLVSGAYLPEKPVMDVRTLCPSPEQKNYSESNSRLIRKLLDMEVRGDSTEENFRAPTVANYVAVYRARRCTPVEVGEAVLDAIFRSNQLSPPLRAIVDYNPRAVRKMARASADRWREGSPLSLLDGVPVAVKGEFCTEPYQFRCGSLFEPIIVRESPQSYLVTNLKKAGAIIIGVANMQEFGCGAVGSNPNRFNLTARNPYNTAHYAGGSSSGSGVSVAAGLCPIALGADAGGSIRIPASLCGTVGLKPTYGVLSGEGETPVTPSLCAPGPLCESVLDTVVAMDILSKDLNGISTISLDGIDVTSLSGLKVGVYWDFFNHCDQNVLKVCRAAVQSLESVGAEVIEVKIPELEESRIAHLLTVSSEFSNALACDIDQHFSLFNPETFLIASTGFQFTAVEFLNAQKQRNRAVTYLQHIFKQVDLLVTPTTACAAPFIDQDAISRGKSLGTISGKLTRFCALGNLTGVPSISLPMGLTDDGLPVGLQLVGRWYEEHVLLRTSWALERSGLLCRKRPLVYYDILDSATNKS